MLSSFTPATYSISADSLVKFPFWESILLNICYMLGTYSISEDLFVKFPNFGMAYSHTPVTFSISSEELRPYWPGAGTQM